MNEKEFAELAAGHALNALSDTDLHAFHEALEAHPEWAATAAADADTAAALAETVADAAPPAALRDTLLARIADLPQEPVAPLAAVVSAPGDPEQSWAGEPEAIVEPPVHTEPVRAVAAPRRRALRGWFALAASVSLLLVLGFGVAVITQQVDRPPVVVALDEIRSAPDAEVATVELADGGTATVHWSASLGESVFVGEGMPDLADDETFELWVVNEAGAVSAGTFETAAGTASAVLAEDLHAGDLVAVTVEPDGGSPTGQPTTEPLFAIPTA